MQIVKAKVLGFCFGVRRAVTMIENELEQSGPLYTLGAIVHNTHVVEELADKGVQLVKTLDDVPNKGAVAITAHGAGEEVYEEIKRHSLRLIDTTCPIVRRAQETAAHLVDEGFFVVLYGEAEHPEVKGILSWTRGQGVATQTPDITVPAEAKGIAIIAQTTKNPTQFGEFVQQIAKRYTGKVPEIRIVDTTCPETGRRYQAAKELAKRVEALIVVGSRSSANTRKLAKTCRVTGAPTYHIETASEIEEDWLAGIDCFGVTAGASTPDDIIEEVVQRLQGSNEGSLTKGGMEIAGIS
ncbi:MAG TPA: 4-hydroxy-3-methylbut-2-enyl diphosphate reductase [Candidatus Heimdallarchaeota archaeon]|nr:4-hydroxy-3-methylbut-2-enyl diphosphate reductase [Candidatus Heimdallarchaeota archaeon]